LVYRVIKNYLMDIRKKLEKEITETINENAKKMKDSLRPVPDIPAKREFLDHIQKARKENLERIKKLLDS
jgi:hypothetical protein